MRRKWLQGHRLCVCYFSFSVLAVSYGLWIFDYVCLKQFEKKKTPTLLIDGFVLFAWPRQRWVLSVPLLQSSHFCKQCYKEIACKKNNAYGYTPTVGLTRAFSLCWLITSCQWFDRVVAYTKNLAGKSITSRLISRSIWKRCGDWNLKEDGNNIYMYFCIYMCVCMHVCVYTHIHLQ